MITILSLSVITIDVIIIFYPVAIASPKMFKGNQLEKLISLALGSHSSRIYLNGKMKCYDTPYSYNISAMTTI